MFKFGLTFYLEVKLSQFLFRHNSIIPTKYKKTYNMKNEKNAARFYKGNAFN